VVPGVDVGMETAIATTSHHRRPCDMHRTATSSESAWNNETTELNSSIYHHNAVIYLLHTALQPHVASTASVYECVRQHLLINTANIDKARMTTALSILTTIFQVDLGWPVSKFLYSGFHWS